MAVVTTSSRRNEPQHHGAVADELSITGAHRDVPSPFTYGSVPPESVVEIHGRSTPVAPRRSSVETEGLLPVGGQSFSAELRRVSFLVQVHLAYVTGSAAPKTHARNTQSSTAEPCQQVTWSCTVQPRKVGRGVRCSGRRLARRHRHRIRFGPKIAKSRAWEQVEKQVPHGNNRLKTGGSPPTIMVARIAASRWARSRRLFMQRFSNGTVKPRCKRDRMEAFFERRGDTGECVSA